MASLNFPESFGFSSVVRHCSPISASFQIVQKGTQNIKYIFGQSQNNYFLLLFKIHKKKL